MSAAFGGGAGSSLYQFFWWVQIPRVAVVTRSPLLTLPVCILTHPCCLTGACPHPSFQETVFSKESGPIKTRTKRGHKAPDSRALLAGPLSFQPSLEQGKIKKSSQQPEECTLACGDGVGCHVAACSREPMGSFRKPSSQTPEKCRKPG